MQTLTSLFSEIKFGFMEPKPDLGREISKLIELYKKKIPYGKRLQQAARLKKDDNFLSELSGIKKRLGKAFFKCLCEGISFLDDFTEPVLCPKSNSMNFRDPLLEGDQLVYTSNTSLVNFVFLKIRFSKVYN